MIYRYIASLLALLKKKTNIKNLITNNILKLFSDLFQFDNSYSWFQSKKVSYVIEVLDPDVMSKDSEHTCGEASNVHLHSNTDAGTGVLGSDKQGDVQSNGGVDMDHMVSTL